MFFLKTVICDFINIAQYYHYIKLVTINLTIDQINHHFKVKIKSFLYLINSVKSFLSKVLVFFMWLHKWLWYLFTLHGFYLPTSLISDMIPGANIISEKARTYEFYEHQWSWGAGGALNLHPLQGSLRRQGSLKKIRLFKATRLAQNMFKCGKNNYCSEL